MRKNLSLGHPPYGSDSFPLADTLVRNFLFR